MRLSAENKLQTLCMAFGATALAAPLLLVRRTEEDAYITFRMAENLVAGYGYTFDRYSLQSASSSPLFVLLVSGTRLLHFSAPLGAFVIEMFSVVAVGALIGMFISKCNATLSASTKLMVVVLADMLLVFSPYGYWALSGLESGLMALLLLTVLFMLHGKRYGTALLCALLVAFTRLEGVAYLLLTIGVVLFETRKEGRERLIPILRYAALAFTCWAIGLVIHRLYFGRAFPNSFYLKGAVPLSDIIGGLRYVINSLFSIPAILTLLAFTWGTMLTLKRIALRVPNTFGLSAAVVAGLIAIRAGGDYMPNYRLVSWVLPVIVVVILSDLLSGYQENPISRRVLLAMMAATFFSGYEKFRPWMVDRQAYSALLEGRVQAGKMFDQMQGNRRYSVGLGTIGAFGYGALNAHIVDPLLLGNSEAIEYSVVDVSAGAGHRLHNFAYLEKEKPDVLIIFPGLSEKTSEAITEDVRARAEGTSSSKLTPLVSRQIAQLALSPQYQLCWLALPAGRQYYFLRRDFDDRSLLH
jgi:hypothetical protein